MDDLIHEFVSETVDNLAILDQELVRFEQSPEDEAILGNIFRMLHTIKGTCGFLGLPRLERVAHAGEDILGKFRDGDLTPEPNSVTAILKCMDRIRTIVDNLSKDGVEGKPDDEALIKELKAIAAGGDQVAAPASAQEEKIEVAAPVGGGDFPVAAELLEEFDQIVAQQATKPEVLPETMPAPASLRVVESKLPEKQASEKQVVEKVSADAPRDNKAPPQTIRVNVEVLENLMTLVSEMVLTRNQLLQLVRTPENSTFKGPIERLSRTTSELQEGVMKTRMQPIGNAWGKLPRIVRDLANELGKKINLNLSGEDTELDRQVLELIQDPLTHMVRNSADHGLETPEERSAAGKPDTGTIHLSALHEGGHIIIKISDDGRGINTARIRQKVLERGLATETELASMDDNQVNKFIMRAGFSTAEKLTKVSGRGVGMDVVRSNIEKIGGTIEFNSVFGQGSTFVIKIPLTLAIISSLIVVCGGDRYALPQIAVKEIVRISRRSGNSIETISNTPILRLRDRLLPLVNLSELLQIEGSNASWAKGRKDYEGYVVVCRNGSMDLGVIVDRIADAEEIVVKPLSGILTAPKYFSGNTILGDGNVILILDVNGLASNLSEEAYQSQSTETEIAEQNADTQNILLFRAGTAALKAVPLSEVIRIEHFASSSIEVTQGEKVVQYRGELMPLLSMPDSEFSGVSKRQLALVFGNESKHVGLAISDIIDIVNDDLKLMKPAKQDGLLGSGITAGRAVDIIDSTFYIAQALPSIETQPLKIGAVA